MLFFFKKKKVKYIYIYIYKEFFKNYVRIGPNADCLKPVGLIPRSLHRWPTVV
jgi:hypothetical protein